MAGTLELSANSIVRDRGISEKYRLRRGGKPKELRLLLRGAPQGSATTVDILDDGVSIFTAAPQLSAGETRRTRRHFKTTGPSLIEKDSIVTLAITATGSGYAGDNLTVELDLED